MSTLDQARRLLQQGDDAGAIALAQNCLRGPQAADAHNLIGRAALRLGNVPLARQSFERLTALQPKHPGSWLNLALAALEARDLNQAEQATRRVLSLAPGQADYRFMLATVLLLQGRLDASRAALDDTLKVDPRHPAALFSRYEFDAGRQPVAAWPGLWQALEGIDLGSLQKALLALSRLVHAWLSGGDAAALEQAFRAFAAATNTFLLQGAGAADGMAWKQSQIARTAATLKAYFAMFQNLLGRYPLPAPADGLPRLWLVGDSHVVPPQGQQAPLEGVSHVLAAQLVMGCKLWHLAQPADNPRRANLAAQLAALPAGAACVVSLGEIDLRPTEGMWSVARRKDIPWAELITRTIPPAVAWLAARRGGRRLIIAGTPVPHRAQMARLPEEQRPEYRRFVAAANQALQAAALAQGLEFLDLQTFTGDGRGGPNQALYLDDVHLVPAALPAALAGHLVGGNRAAA
jgi:tetratricopeptide (TPR) repeat protein